MATIPVLCLFPYDEQHVAVGLTMSRRSIRFATSSRSMDLKTRSKRTICQLLSENKYIVKKWILVRGSNRTLSNP
jgi:hypothetical protein